MDNPFRKAVHAVRIIPQPPHAGRALFLAKEGRHGILTACPNTATEYLADDSKPPCHPREIRMTPEGISAAAIHYGAFPRSAGGPLGF